MEVWIIDWQLRGVDVAILLRGLVSQFLNGNLRNEFDYLQRRDMFVTTILKNFTVVSCR